MLVNIINNRDNGDNMALKDYLEYYKQSKNVNEFFNLIRKSGNKGKEATIKRYYYKFKLI